MAMHGERVPATRLLGGRNSPHKDGYFTGGTSTATGVLGPRRERHNKVMKRKANAQRRRHDRRVIRQALALHAQEAAEQALASYEQYERPEYHTRLPAWGRD